VTAEDGLDIRHMHEMPVAASTTPATTGAAATATLTTVDATVLTAEETACTSPPKSPSWPVGSVRMRGLPST